MKITNLSSCFTTPALALVLAIIPIFASASGPGAGAPKGRPAPTPTQRASFEAARQKFNQLLRESPARGTAPAQNMQAVQAAEARRARAAGVNLLAQLRRNPNLVLATQGSTPDIRAAAQQAANLARNGQHQVIPIPRGGNPVLNQAQQNQGNP